MRAIQLSAELDPLPELPPNDSSNCVLVSLVIQRVVYIERLCESIGSGRSLLSSFTTGFW